MPKFKLEVYRYLQEMICVFQSPLLATPPAGPLSWELLHPGAIFLDSAGSKSKANRKLMPCEGVHK